MSTSPEDTARTVRRLEGMAAAPAQVASAVADPGDELDRIPGLLDR